MKAQRTLPAQGFKGGKSQTLGKKQQRMEMMRKNPSPGVRGYSIDDELYH
jgi:hypothetical protein